jgi:hypothetical protein
MPVKKKYQIQTDSTSSKLQGVVFITLVSVIGFFTHQIFLRSGFMMNPDESELLATAKLAAMPGGLNENYTTSTYGPIWPEFLGILNHLGMTLDHFSAHQLAFFMKALIFLPPQYLAIKKNGFFKLSPALITLNIVLFTPTSNEFSFLATELLPLAILTIAVILIVKVQTKFSLVVAGILFTFSIFSKYQSLLMIFILVYFILLRQTKNETFLPKKFKRDLFSFFFSIFLSTCTILLLLLNSNSLSKFLKESFLLSINYSTVQGFGGGANLIDKFNVGSTLLIGQPLILLAALSLVIVAADTAIPKLMLEVAHIRIDSTIFRFASLILFLLVAFLTISIPGNAFPHYLLFFVWTLNIFLLSLDFTDVERNSQPKTRKFVQSLASKNSSIVATLLILLLASISTAVPKFKDLPNTTGAIQNNQTRFNELKSAEVLTYCPKGSRVLVWGWSSELFAYFNWLPVPNVVNDVARIKISQLSEESIVRINAGINDSKTDCIYEAIGGQYFGGFVPSDGVESNSADLLDVLNREYLKVILQDGTSVWKRKS